MNSSRCVKVLLCPGSAGPWGACSCGDETPRAQSCALSLVSLITGASPALFFFLSLILFIYLFLFAPALCIFNHILGQLQLPGLLWLHVCYRPHLLSSQLKELFKIINPSLASTTQMKYASLGKILKQISSTLA